MDGLAAQDASLCANDDLAIERAFEDCLVVACLVGLVLSLARIGGR
jgi:hypothetical protein